MSLSCENEFCIYQKQGNCILSSVELDERGSCLNCIYIDVEERVLNNFKEQLLKKFGDLA